MSAPATLQEELANEFPDLIKTKRRESQVLRKPTNGLAEQFSTFLILHVFFKHGRTGKVQRLKV